MDQDVGVDNFDDNSDDNVNGVDYSHDDNIDDKGDDNIKVRLTK